MQAASPLTALETTSEDLPPAALRAAAPGSLWPERLRAAGAEELSPAELAERAGAWDDGSIPPLLLGYTDPVRALAQALEAAGAGGDTPEPDPLVLLEEWLRATGLFLELRRRWPAQVRLLRLEPAADTDPAEALDPRLQALLQAVPEVAERHADLEGCADLEGREPSFSLGLPPLRGGSFASLCLESWRQDRIALKRLAAERLELQREREALVEDRDTRHHDLSARLDEAQQELRLLERELEKLGVLERELAELRLLERELEKLREGEAERAAASEQHRLELEQALELSQAGSELTRAQLDAVQDSLEQLYGERRRVEDALQRLGSERDLLGHEATSLRQELEALQAEVAHYLRASTPGPQLDRSRIPRLTALLREALHLQ